RKVVKQDHLQQNRGRDGHDGEQHPPHYGVAPGLAGPRRLTGWPPGLRWPPGLGGPPGLRSRRGRSWRRGWWGWGGGWVAGWGGGGGGWGGGVGSTESRGLCRGGAITTPTTPRVPSLANGRTNATLVRALGLTSTRVITPTGTPGT